MVLYYMGRVDEARAELEANRTADPIHVLQLLSDLSVDARDEDQALAYAQQCCSGELKRKAQLAYVHASFGRREQAVQMLRELAPHGVAAAPPLEAKAWIAAGDVEAAIESLLREPATIYAIYVVGHPAFAPLRAHPRYVEVLRAVGLEPYYPAARDVQGGRES
jgi:hypothetical protein